MMLLKNRIRVVACNSEISCGKAGRSSIDVTPVDRLLIPCEPFPVARGLEQNKGLSSSLSNVRRCTQIHAGHKSVSFFFSKILFCAIFVPAFKKHSIVSRIACNAWPVCVYFAFILLWKINFPNEISKRNLGRLLCEKKFIQPRFKYSLALFVFLTTLNCFGKKWRSFSFRAGKWAEFIYIYILIITGVQASWEKSRVYIYIY